MLGNIKLQDVIMKQSHWVRNIIIHSYPSREQSLLIQTNLDFKKG